MNKFSYMMGALVFTVISVVSGETIELEAQQDAYICCCLPDSTNPNGGKDYLYHGQYGSCYDRTLIQWDLSAIPAGTEIASATMMLYCEAFYGTRTGNPVYYMIQGDWSEQTVTYNTQPDYSTSVEVIGYWPQADEWYEVDITDFVISWLDGTADNYGIYCFCEGTTGTCVPGFWSKDYQTASLHPKLVIDTSTGSLELSTWASIKSI